MTPIEKVARAICAAEHLPAYEDWSSEENADFISDHWHNYVGEARAAIEALMEPTEEMIIAAKPFYSSKEILSAMLRKALED